MNPANITPIQFGTDGWRARMDQAFTAPNVIRLAHAFASWVIDNKAANQGIVIGYDCRDKSDYFANTVAEVLLSRGIHVTLSDRPCPTPTVSYSVLRLRAFAGIVITASHNPPEFNGFKIKDALGKSADQTVTKQIEAALDRAHVPATTPGKLTSCDLCAAYLGNIGRCVDLNLLRSSNLRVLVNAMHGSGSGLMKQLLPDLTEMNEDRDITFGGKNPEPIMANLGDMQDRMQTEHFDLGIILDGDADRLGAMAPGGIFLSAQDVYVLILWHLLKNKNKRGLIARSFNITDRVQVLADAFQCACKTTPIGFKYLAEYLLDEKTLMAGEESGGYGVQYYLPERDGIFCGMLLMELMASSGQSISEILGEIGTIAGSAAYDRLDVHLESATQRQTLEKTIEQLKHADEFAGHPVIGVETLDGLKLRFGPCHWILFRLSGTEPLLRVYAEGTDNTAVSVLLTAAKKIIYIFSVL